MQPSQRLDPAADAGGRAVMADMLYGANLRFELRGGGELGVVVIQRRSAHCIGARSSALVTRLAEPGRLNIPRPGDQALKGSRPRY
jgi:hypothetical protein